MTTCALAISAVVFSLIYVLLLSTPWQYRISPSLYRLLHPDNVHAKHINSPKFSSRNGQKIRFIVLHYTASYTTFENLMTWMIHSPSKVSSHYFIDMQGNVVQMVEEKNAAWHAGNSAWADVVGLNESSIGIELENIGYEFYTDAQMQTVVNLMHDIIARYGIEPQNIIAHSDIQPLVKLDPGEFFDWKWLASQGIGDWPETNTQPGGEELQLGDTGENITALQTRLTQYGYSLPISSEYDATTQMIVFAFQRRFRPDRINGRWDADCDAKLTALLELHTRK